MTSSKNHGRTAPNETSFETEKRSLMIVENTLYVDLSTHPYREAV